MDSLHISSRWILAVGLAIGVGLGATAWATESKTETVITTNKVCETCAKKIVDKLRLTKGVADARAEVASKIFVVTPVAGRELSPRALWEAVELSGETPIRLTGPAGTFVTKPKS